MSEFDRVNTDRNLIYQSILTNLQNPYGNRSAIRVFATENGHTERWNYVEGEFGQPRYNGEGGQPPVHIKPEHFVEDEGLDALPDSATIVDAEDILEPYLKDEIDVFVDHPDQDSKVVPIYY